MGRATDPTEEEISNSERALAAAGTGGWLAIAQHSFYRPEFPNCVDVRRLGDPDGTFAEAVEAVRRFVREKG